MSVPNQMIIQEFNYEPCNEKDYYAKINLEALQHAMQDLPSLNTLKLWLYLSKNKVGFSHLELSSADCINNWGLGKSQWKETKMVLIDRGYLVPLKVDKKTGWYKFIQNPDSGKNTDDEIPETELLIFDDIPETGNLSDNKIPETEQKFRKPEKYKVIENPETGKSSIDKIPETGKLNPETELISPEIIEERLQYYIDNIIIDNIDEWEECRGYTLKYAIDTLNCQIVAEDEKWYYVITGNNRKIRFDRSQNSQYMNYANMF